DDGAGTALRDAAAEFDALRADLVAQDVEQRFGAVRDGHGREGAVHVDVEGQRGCSHFSWSPFFVQSAGSGTPGSAYFSKRVRRRAWPPRQACCLMQDLQG